MKYIMQFYYSINIKMKLHNLNSEFFYSLKCFHFFVLLLATSVKSLTVISQELYSQLM